MSSVLAITGTSTDVGKTVVTAALAAAADDLGITAAVCKPAQTGVTDGEPGDLDEIRRLAGPRPAAEGVRYRDPLAPETAARLADAGPVTLPAISGIVDALAAAAPAVLVEGAGGILVRLAADLTLLDVAAAADARVVVVTAAGLGALNHAELTVAAVRQAGLSVAGLIIGAWPEHPDLATRHNRIDLPRLTGAPLVGVVPDGAGRLRPAEFRTAAPGWIDRGWLARELRVLDSSPAAGVRRA